MIRVLAIDDEPLALQQLATYIRKVPTLELVAECQSAIEAKEILNREIIDAIFCDISMPDLNGMEFVKSLSSPPLVVFTSAYTEYAIEGYKVDAVDYLLKPFGLNDFQRAVKRITDRLKALESEPKNTSQKGDDDESIFVKTEYKVIKIAIKDIKYIEGMSEYLKIHLTSQPKPIITLLAIKKIEEYLPENFMRIHRSYIVNLTMIKEVNKNRVILDNDTYLPIGDNYKDAFNEYLNKKFLGK